MASTLGTGVPGTGMATGVAGGGAYLGGRTVVPEGKYTATVYGLIKDGKYGDAVGILAMELQSFPRSRAALSLMGHCYYMLQDYRSSAQAYEQLVRLFPTVEIYQVYYAQSLYKAGLYAEAARAAQLVEDESLSHRVTMLLAAIRYEEEDLAACRSLVDRGLPDEPETQVNGACILYKEERFADAEDGFARALDQLGYQADLSYNIALCHYRQRQFGPALKRVADIIERGVREHPELSVGSNTDGIETRSVGNTQVLRETALIEAFNLKAAIEYSLKNMDAAREALSDMPPREEHELDPVTLHNLGLMHMDEDASGGFHKLSFLVRNPPFPPAAFRNLLLLYIQHDFLDQAADILAELPFLAETFLDAETLEFVQAMVMLQSSPAEAYRRLDVLAGRHVESLRKFTKQIQDARMQQSSEAIKAALKRYDEALEQFIPVLMASARVYWDRGNYTAVERIFRRSADFCPEHETWKLNAAHVFFMQGGHFAEAIRYYRPIVDAHREDLLEIPAIVLANLCVAYILSSRNREAEDIMRRIEAAEKSAERDADEEAPVRPRKPFFHLCIVNLVIGTLYCTKGNYEFGVGRVMTSLRPLDKKLGVDTWFYAKRCFLALAEQIAKRMLVISDRGMRDILAFLRDADRAGRRIVTVPAEEEGGDARTVSHEARLLRSLYLKLQDA